MRTDGYAPWGLPSLRISLPHCLIVEIPLALCAGHSFPTASMTSASVKICGSTVALPLPS
jgi:hypothetical protein